ncbi:MAG: WD40/YVTN/BNR-like repeat-containing protein, partial [bacterium]
MKLAKFFLTLGFGAMLAFSHHEALAQTDFWQQTNGPYGGDIRALAINKSNGYIFAGTFGGGVFRSTDNGENWTPVNNGLTVTSIVSLAIDSKNGDLYAGTGTLALFARVDGAIFRSTDHGENWTRVNTALFNDNVISLAINDSGHVFAGTFEHGVLRSKDSGKTWIPINNRLMNMEVHSLVINSAGHIFAGTFGGRVFRS